MLLKKANIKKICNVKSMGADKPEEASQLRIFILKLMPTIFKSSGLQYSIVRPGTLTNDSPKHCARAQIKHGEISRADVAKTLVKAWMIILPRILHLKL
jgi:hypothetical protein